MGLTPTYILYLWDVRALGDYLEEIVKNKEVFNNQSSRLVIAVFGLVMIGAPYNYFAKKLYSLTAKVNYKVAPEEPNEVYVDIKVDDAAWFYCAITSSAWFRSVNQTKVLARLIALLMCPFDLAVYLFFERKLQRNRTYEGLGYTIGEISCKMFLGKCEYALEMLARSHNQEQHTKNGNIHFQAREGENNYEIAHRCADIAGNRVEIKTSSTYDLNGCEAELPKCNISRNYRIWQEVVFAPSSCHSLAYRLDPALAAAALTHAPLVPASSQTVADTASTSALSNDAGEAAIVTDDTETTVALQAQVSLLTLNESQTTKNNKNGFQILYDDCVKRISRGLTISEGIDIMREMVKVFTQMRYSNHCSISTDKYSSMFDFVGDNMYTVHDCYWFGVSVNPPLNTGTFRVQEVPNVPNASAKHLRADLRLPMLKLKLYDHMRQPSRNFPTGVEWAVPVRAEIPQLYTALDVLDDWKYNFIVVHDSIILHAIIYNGGFIEVDKERWGLKCREVSLIMLNAAHTSILWALQLITRLPFPLQSCYEMFLMKDPSINKTLKYEIFIRNECLVNIPSRVRNIIFVVTNTAPNIIIGGVKCMVHNLVKGESPKIAAANARDVIIGCLNIINVQKQPLTKIMRPWLEARCDGAGIDWGEIDSLVTLLCERFPPQVEVLHKDTDLIEIHWAGPNYLQEELGTNCIPGKLVYHDSATSYYSKHSVNIFDQAPAARDLTESGPIVFLGEWSNVAEYITGIGWARFVSGTVSTTPTDAARESSSPLDRVNRALHLRRSFEEFKTAASIIDAIVAPKNCYTDISVFNLLSREEICLGNFAVGILSNSGNLTLLSWLINYDAKIVPTSTGIRTPSAMWLSPHSDGSSLNFLNVDGYEIQGCDRWNGWFAQICPEIQMANGLQQELIRVDLNSINLSKVAYMQRPSYDLVSSFAWRIESSVFHKLSYDNGWRVGQLKIIAAAGWGLPVHRLPVEYWYSMRYQTLCFDSSILSMLQSDLMLRNVVWRSGTQRSSNR